jgi:hypothetical protein
MIVQLKKGTLSSEKGSIAVSPEKGVLSFAKRKIFPPSIVG